MASFNLTRICVVFWTGRFPDFSRMGEATELYIKPKQALHLDLFLILLLCDRIGYLSRGGIN